jgi:hypothetical protein
MKIVGSVSTLDELLSLLTVENSWQFFQLGALIPVRWWMSDHCS